MMLVVMTNETSKNKKTKNKIIKAQAKSSGSLRAYVQLPEER